MNVDAFSIDALKDQLDAVECDARKLAAALDEAQGVWRAETGSWSVAACLEHLSRTNRVYLDAMSGSAILARERGRVSRGRIAPGIIGRWFVRTMEPPVKRHFRTKAPHIVEPSGTHSLADALTSFTTSQEEVRKFLDACADIDLAGVRFPNPFVKGIRFSLATGLHIIAAHERRHMWQAWRIRQAAESSTAIR
jgi:hypothetical protein